MSFNLQPQFSQIPFVKISYNIGCLFDIPTGAYETGIHGESILNGGLGAITGVVGIGNNFKSTIMHFMMLSAMARFAGSTSNTYDTEINMLLSRLSQLALAIKEFNGEDVIDNGRWQVTDKTLYYANEWYEIWKKFIKEKRDNLSKISIVTPFIDRDGKSLMKVSIPTFTEIDSFSEFETEDVATMQASNELGDSGALTLHMKQGLSKLRFLTDIPKLIANGNNPLLMTAHIGKEIPMDSRAPAVKKLQYLKNGDKLKGVTDKFTFLTTNCWQCQNATPLINDTTKAAEYPRNSEENQRKGDTDLFIVTLVQLRSKTGPTGLIMQIVVSQQEGVLPSLSEFHYLKTMDRFGFGGNRDNYYMELLPEVKLSRTTVRGKLDRDAKLRRAMNITAEMCQMKMLWSKLPEDLICTPKQLYDDLITLGYDWDTLLNTRGWWTADNDNHPIPFLSTMDLLKMRKKEYIPFWWPNKENLKINN